MDEVRVAGAAVLRATLRSVPTRVRPVVVGTRCAALRMAGAGRELYPSLASRVRRVISILSMRRPSMSTTR